MDERRNLRRLERLLSVQRLKRLGCEAALAQAQQLEREARATEEVAHVACDHAQAEWNDYLVRPGFSPEYSQALSSRVLACDAKLQQAQLNTLQRVDATSVKERSWQQSQAQVHQTDASTRRVARKLERKREEARMNEIGERITFAWSRR